MAGKTRGTVRNKDRLEAFARPTPTSGANWGNCDGLLVQAVVVAITEMGGAAIFGMSRDRGAHLLTLMLDDTKQTLWFNGDAVLDDELQEVVDKLTQIE